MAHVRALFAGLAVFLVAAIVSAGSAWARAGRTPTVAVLPFEGENGPLVRNEVLRLVRSRGFHTTTSIPRVDGTAQYLILAREHHLTAFVTGDLETHKRRRTSTITFLIWNGATGSVLGRWSVTASSRRLHKSAARGFLKYLGRALDAAHPPPLPLDQDPAPPMFIDASDRI